MLICQENNNAYDVFVTATCALVMQIQENDERDRRDNRREATARAEMQAMKGTTTTALFALQFKKY